MPNDFVALSADFCRSMLRCRREFLARAAADGAGALASARDRAEAEAASFRTMAASGVIRELDDGKPRAAFWINAYNGLSSLSILELGATLELPRYPAYRVRTVIRIGDGSLSLNDIAEGILRGNRPSPGWPFRPFGRRDRRRSLILGEPDFRLHFALNFGAASCPPVRAYSAERLSEELAEAEGRFAAAHFRPDPAARTIVCSRLFMLRRRDFPGRWLDDPAYRGWKARAESFDQRPGPGGTEEDGSA